MGCGIEPEACPATDNSTTSILRPFFKKLHLKMLIRSFLDQSPLSTGAESRNLDVGRVHTFGVPSCDFDGKTIDLELV